MQFLIFILLVTLVSVPFLSFPNALLYAIGMLLFLIFGQMAIGAVILLIETIFRGKQLEARAKSAKRDLKFGVLLTRVIAFVLVLYFSIQHNQLLVIPAVIGISYWLFAEYVGEKKYMIKFL